MSPSWIELTSRHTHINIWVSWQSLPDPNLQRSDQAIRSLLKLSNNIHICSSLHRCTGAQVPVYCFQKAVYNFSQISTYRHLPISQPYPYSISLIRSFLPLFPVCPLRTILNDLHPVNDSSATYCSQREHLMISLSSLHLSADKTTRYVFNQQSVYFLIRLTTWKG